MSDRKDGIVQVGGRLVQVQRLAGIALDGHAHGRLLGEPGRRPKARADHLG